MTIFASFHLVTVTQLTSKLSLRNGGQEEYDVKEAYVNDFFEADAFTPEVKVEFEKQISAKYAFLAEKNGIKAKTNATMLSFAILPEVAEKKTIITEVKG